MVRRRSYQLRGPKGTMLIEAEQIPDSGIDIHEVDGLGRAVNGKFLVHTWTESDDKVSLLLSQAVREGRV